MKKLILILAMLVMASSCATTQATNHPRWEYDQVLTNSMTKLDLWGLEGWEVVGITVIHTNQGRKLLVVLKRPMLEKPEPKKSEPKKAP